MNILIRDVPDEVRETLAAIARARGQSMQAYLVEVLASQARLSRNMALIDEVRALIDPSQVEPMDPDLSVADLIRQQRQERSDHQMRVLDEWHEDS